MTGPATLHRGGRHDDSPRSQPRYRQARRRRRRASPGGPRTCCRPWSTSRPRRRPEGGSHEATDRAGAAGWPPAARVLRAIRRRPTSGPAPDALAWLRLHHRRAGYIITNQHVAKKADKVTVVLPTRGRLDARSSAPTRQPILALLKVSTKKDLPEVDWGNSGRPRSVTARWRSVLVRPGRIRDRGGSFPPAAGDQGRSLQPLHPDRHGDQPGPQLRRTAVQRGWQGDRRQHGDPLAQRRQRRWSGSPLPTKVAKPIMAELQQDGEVTRGWLGVMVHPITPQLALRGLKFRRITAPWSATSSTADRPRRAV